jgi:hypothetical protein
MAMTSLLLIEVGAPLVQADTLVTVASRDVFDIIYAAAAGAFVILLLVLIVALLGALAQLRSGLKGMQRAVASAREAVLKDEAVERIRVTAGHVEAMAGTLRAETERAGESIRKVSEQVDLASRRMEERIEEFNALLAVVQDEAEETFLDTASTARGMRAGFGELTRKADRRRRELRGRDNGGPLPVRPAPLPASPPDTDANPVPSDPSAGRDAPLFPPDAGDRTPPTARHPHDEELP